MTDDEHDEQDAHKAADIEANTPITVGVDYSLAELRIVAHQLQTQITQLESQHHKMLPALRANLERVRRIIERIENGGN